MDEKNLYRLGALEKANLYVGTYIYIYSHQFTPNVADQKLSKKFEYAIRKANAVYMKKLNKGIKCNNKKLY